MRVLWIDLDRRGWFETEVGEVGPVSLGVKVHREFKTWGFDPLDPKCPVIIGVGPFVCGRLFGVHRLVVTFKSPMSRTLHISTLGGAGVEFARTGYDAIVIFGKSERPVGIFISDERISIENIEPKFDYDGRKGVYAFTKYLLDRYREFFVKYKARALVVGPGALKTYNGCIASIAIDYGKLDFKPGAEDFAGRGGPGTALAQGHGVVAVVFGGRECRPRHPKIADISFIDGLFKEVLGKGYVDVVKAKTGKYHYDEKIKAGGTFGVNYPHYRELLPMFGYKSIYLPKEVRIRLSEYILEYFWKPFVMEAFAKGASGYTCGDICPVACKKVWRGKKVDYEPFHAMGPFIGNFIFEEAIPLVDLIDSYGLDAIEMGHVVAWIFDAIEHGLLRPEEVGLNDKPIFDPLKFEPLSDSRKNAKLAFELIRGFVEGSTEVLRIIAKRGIRQAAKELDEMFRDRVMERGKSFRDLIVYAVFGSEGYMTPNLYWAPGLIAPMYVLGRYWTDYSTTFTGPEEFAKSSIKRAMAECTIDDSGICRFHRGWFEAIAERLYRDVIGKQPVRGLYKEFAEYAIMAGAEPLPWEGERARDLISTLAREVSSREWVFRDFEDYVEWWRRFKITIDSELGVTPR